MNEPKPSDEDPTLGFRSNLDSSFAAAEQRMRRRVASEIGVAAPSPAPAHDPAPGQDHALPAYVTPSPGRRHRSRRRGLAVGAVALVIAVLGAGLVWGRVSRTAEEVPSVAAIAAAAATTPAAPFAAGDPVVFEVLTIEERGSATVSRLTRTTVDADGTGLVEAGAEQLEAGDAGTALAGPSTTETSLGSVVADLAYVELLGLPTDPTVLAVSIESQLDRPERAQVAEVLAWLASAEAAAPAERAAAIEALGELATSGPARATDPLGREGVQLGGDGWSVIVDPVDGSALALHLTAAPSGADPDESTWTVWNP